jgi:hypothetical protein
VAPNERNMLDAEKSESEEDKVERILDAAAERLAELLIANWEYRTRDPKQREVPSNPLPDDGKAR